MGCASSSEQAANHPMQEKGESWENAHSKYEFGEKVGKGSFSQVHIVIRRQTRVEAAVKIRHLFPDPHQKDKVWRSSINELLMWNAVGTHANCVRLLDSFFDNHLAYMVMEKCDSSLFKYLQGLANVNEACMAKAFGEMLAGISHMHSISVMHRDLKPDNFLVRGHTVKICDFGLSAVVPTCAYFTGFVGTAPYMAPEMLATQTYDEKADVWSFGVVAYLLLCGDYPYKTSDGSPKMMTKSILMGGAPHCDKEWLSIEAINFLRAVLNRESSRRSSAKLALHLPFISNPNKSLRSIRKVLHQAEKSGAFDSKELASITPTDLILQKLKNGDLENRSIQSFSNVDIKSFLSKNRPVDTKAKFANAMGRTPSSESTACGSSSPSSVYASESRQQRVEVLTPR